MKQYKGRKVKSKMDKKDIYNIKICERCKRELFMRGDRLKCPLCDGTGSIKKELVKVESSSVEKPVVPTSPEENKEK